MKNTSLQVSTAAKAKENGYKNGAIICIVIFILFIIALVTFLLKNPKSGGYGYT